MMHGSYLSEAQAQSILGPLEQRLFQVVMTAWQRWDALCEACPEYRAAASGRGRANVIYDFIAQEVRRSISGKNVAVTDRRGFVEIYVDGVIALRFKKVNRQYRSSNYPTRTQILYNKQLPLFPGDTVLGKRLTVGYLLNDTGTDVADVFLIYREDTEIVWARSIRTDDGQVGITIPMPAPESPLIPARITAKRRTPAQKEEIA